MVGETISHYKVEKKIGAGGMGVVYRAQDLRLNRPVALKFLPRDFGEDDEHRLRFIHEAKAASALDHPNICTIHEIDQTPEGDIFIAMAYYEGETVKNRIERGVLPLDEAVDIALQVAHGLAKAHGHGLIHRDIKPANIIITTDGTAKILDFGLAKVAGSTELTRTGTTLGTAAYISPEQAQGMAVDQRSDVWSLGVTLYEMLAGRRPFAGENLSAVVYAVVNMDPAPLRQLRPEVPAALERIVLRALEKSPGARYSSADKLIDDLSAWRQSPVSSETSIPDIRTRKIAVAALLVIAILAGALGWFGYRYSKTSHAREKVLPEIARLIDQGSYTAAFDLALQAERYIPYDPMLARLWSDMSDTVSIQTAPPGADVQVREDASVEGAWRHLGQSPLHGIRVPKGFLRWRITKSGYDSLEVARNIQGESLSFTLAAAGSSPPRMVEVQPGVFRMIHVQLGMLPPMNLGKYWIDKYEVNNREFKEFIDKGGYRNRQFWKYEFVKDGSGLSWEEAMNLFHDSTGRQGPSTWEAGLYPEGKDDFPVSGVSWFEAAAYAEYAGKELPSIYHWYNAAGLMLAAQLVPLSNFNGQGPERDGKYTAVSANGAYDMAGNVKEWCWNATDGKRFILGGAWNEPSYMFSFSESLSPWDRSAANGFRCVRYDSAPPENIIAPLHPEAWDPRNAKPVSDEVFDVLRRMYARSPGPLNARIESTDTSSEYWTTERISYDADSRKERMPAYLVIPKSSSPPYQVLIYLPGGNSLLIPSVKQIYSSAMRQLDFVVKSGRAMLFPAWKGTGERQTGLALDRTVGSETIAQWVKDLGASIDYLQSRPDIDAGKIGYIGSSMGATHGPILVSLDKRIKLAILLDGGLWPAPRPAEASEVNFLPRVTVPVLMLNGRFDFIYTPELCQIPMFHLLGTPDGDKKHVILDSAHDVLSRRRQAASEILDWLDHYFGSTR